MKPGAMEIGAIFNVLLLGVISTQVYYYFSRFPEDHKILKWTVLSVWLIEIAHSASILHALYQATVTFFGNPITLLQPPKTLIVAVSLGGVLTAIVQSFFAWRVYRLVGSLYLSLFCCVLTLLFLAACFGFTITGYHAPSMPVYIRQNDWLLTALLVVRMVNDIIMTTGLCFALFKSRQKAQRKTTAVIDKLLLWTLESGLLTAICAMVVVIFFFASRNTFIWIGVYLISPKLFSNSFLAILNGREGLRLNMGSGVASTMNMDESMIPSRSRGLPGVVDINVVKVQHSSLDYEMGRVPREKF
ncbi:hypothetical protein DL96DRAFT_1820600 [Flagelloscypha sp. PMI_526]|nr:hypothetical protein DL96DRAFT_1820600 [Flagelloscypha sp. PMI_526]